MKILEFFALPLLLLGWCALALGAWLFAFWDWLDDK